MITHPTPHVEAVDPMLQSVATQSLYWLHIDEHTCELRRHTAEPRLDGFDKPSFQVVGLIKYDPKTELYFGYINAQPGLVQTPPDMHVLSRFHLPMAQNELIGFLIDIKRL